MGNTTSEATLAEEIPSACGDIEEMRAAEQLLLPWGIPRFITQQGGGSRFTVKVDDDGFPSIFQRKSNGFPPAKPMLFTCHN